MWKGGDREGEREREREREREGDEGGLHGSFFDSRLYVVVIYLIMFDCLIKNEAYKSPVTATGACQCSAYCRADHVPQLAW